jgi:hypothetical protein
LSATPAITVMRFAMPKPLHDSFRGVPQRRKIGGRLGLS